MPVNKDDLIAKMVHARQMLDAALERLAPQAEIYPAWKLKQLLDHFTGWDELVAGAFRTHAQGDMPDKLMKPGGIDQYNASSVEQRRVFSLEESRQAYHSSREAVINAIQEMPGEKLEQRFPAPWGGTCTVSSVVKIFVDHELEHARQIESRLG